jgi:hypothetical protein
MACWDIVKVNLLPSLQAFLQFYRLTSSHATEKFKFLCHLKAFHDKNYFCLIDLGLFGSKKIICINLGVIKKEQRN